MFVIIVLMVTLAGQPAVIGEYTAANYPTLEACNAARPAVVAKIDAANADQKIKVAEAQCFTREAADKLHEELIRKDSI